MDRHFKRIILVFALFVSLVAVSWASEDWKKDAIRGNHYFWTRDYNAAWLFYQRAIAQSCDDGVILFRAAESFRRQDMVEDEELQAGLYAVAHYFLSRQDPKDSAVRLATKYFDSDKKVTRRTIGGVYRKLDGKPPKIKLLPDMFTLPGIRSIGKVEISRLSAQKIKAYLNKSFGYFKNFVGMILDGHPVKAVQWGKAYALPIAVIWLLLSSLTGIIVPIVMGVTIGSYGKKSYVTAYATLLHWGAFGVHRMYLRRWPSAFLWLLTGGLAGVGLVVDLFLTRFYVDLWNQGRGTGGVPVMKRPKPAKAPKVRKTAKSSGKKVRPPKKNSTGAPKTKLKGKRQNPSDIEKKSRKSHNSDEAYNNQPVEDVMDVFSNANYDSFSDESSRMSDPSGLNNTDLSGDIDDFTVDKPMGDSDSQNDFGDDEFNFEEKS